MIDPRPQGGLKALLAEVAAYYGISVEDIRSRKRDRKFSWPRHAFMWHARQIKWANGEQRYSTTMIGAFLGMDHSTVTFGEHKHAARLAAVSTTNIKGVERDVTTSTTVPKISAGIAA